MGVMPPTVPPTHRGASDSQRRAMSRVQRRHLLQRSRSTWKVGDNDRGGQRARNRRGDLRRHPDDHRRYFGRVAWHRPDCRGTHYVESADYWINTSVSTWGWVHLIVGLVVLAAGFGVISGAAWAPLAGHHLRQHPSNMELPHIPFQPWASIALIVVDLWIIHLVRAPARTGLIHTGSDSSEGAHSA
jgi:hypothetical protein